MKWTTCLLFSWMTLIVQAQVPDSLERIFMYTPAKVLFQVDSNFVEGKVKGERILYVSTDSFITSAYLTSRAELKPGSPLIIFQHWGEGDKSEFLEEAMDFSKKGFVCILPDGPWLCPNTPISSFTRQGYDMYRQCVMNVRTAIDLAIQTMKIDTTQIFMVGHSFGCNTAAMLSAIESRIGYFVFIAGLASMTKNLTETRIADFVEWRTTDPTQFSNWINKARILDAEHYLPHNNVPCLIQVANQDEFISNAENDAFIDITAAPKKAIKYDSNHALNAKARSDRRKWILQHRR